MFIGDAHFHIVQCNRSIQTELLKKQCVAAGIDSSEKIDYSACSCSHTPAEFERQRLLIEESCDKCGDGDTEMLFSAYGIHPQSFASTDEEGVAFPSVKENASFLQSLLEQKKIDAIGEAGFDFFSDNFRATRKEQEDAWRTECDFASSFQKPLIVHDRKALDELFRDAKALRKIPAVLFHSFAFGPREAQSLLDHGINAFFSFGKQLLNGNKKSISCVKELPLERILLETDAPYQILRGEIKTEPEEIIRVYKEASLIRNEGIDYISQSTRQSFAEIFRERRACL